MSRLIECDGCGRSFTTDHPAEMLAAIKGPCPTCGGSFKLAPATAGSASPRAGSAAPPTRRR
jgi:rRNA maturation endonuclease Nob1